MKGTSKLRKPFAVLAIALVFFFFAGQPVIAVSEEEILEDFYNILPPGMEATEEGEISDRLGFDALVGDVFSAVSGEWSGALGFFMLLMGFAIIMAVCEGAYISEIPPLRRTGSAAVSAICATAVFSALYGMLLTVQEGLVTLTDFFSSLSPILTLINASSGAVATASVQALNINITLAILEKFCTGALLPLVFALFSLATVASVGEGGAAAVARGIRSVFMWGVGIICTILAAAIGLQSLVASAQDTAALRAARYAASGTIPIVGSTVASALATLAGGLAFVRSSVGASSIVAILILALSPLVAILLYRLAFSVSIIFLEFVGSEGGVRCFSAFRAALDALLAVYSMAVLICIIEIVVFLKSGVATG